MNKGHYIAFRIMLSLIFLVAGLGHVFNSGKLVTRLEGSPGWPLISGLFPPSFLIVSTGIVLLIGGGGLLMNIKTKSSALALILVLIPITLTVQISVESLGPFFKNIALLGGLIFFYFDAGKHRGERI